MDETVPQEVLVVDDEPILRMVAADALSDCGMMAWEAGNADEALEALERHPQIGLLFTDVNMPGEMNGLGLAHQFRAQRPDMKVVVTSAATPVTPQDLPVGGTFLPKPYPTEQLVTIVAEKLHR
jgi:CheY-like chemotaxis protein